MIVSKSNDCPKCGGGHTNQCFVTYTNGYYCFSCGTASSTDKNNYSFKPYKQRLCDLSIYIPQNVEEDFKNFPLHIQYWLLKYGIDKEEVIKHCIMYVPYEKFITKSGLKFEGESLIFPICNDREIIHYQRRFFPNKQILSVGAGINNLTLSKACSDTVVLVEDFISGIRVNNHADCIPLLGTSLKKYMIEDILAHGKIVIWLDGDEPGQKAAKKIYKTLCDTIKYRTKLNAFNHKKYKLSIVTTEKDPKEYTDSEIKQYLHL